MKGRLRITALLAVGILSGCATTRNYFVDRGRDAGDILTVSAGLGAGAKARVGPFHAGLFFAADLYGVRNGVLLSGGQMCPGGPGGLELDSIIIPFPRDEMPGFFPVIFGMEAFPDRSLTDDRSGGFGAAVSKVPFFSTPCPIDKGVPVRTQTAAKYLTQAEVAGGLLGTLRLGFNAGEFLDFVLGWTTIDIFRDDLAGKKQERKSNQASEVTARKLAGPQH